LGKGIRSTPAGVSQTPHYRTYPESKFSGLADIMVRQAVAFVS